jgi:hypothetical protein
LGKKKLTAIHISHHLIAAAYKLIFKAINLMAFIKVDILLSVVPPLNSSEVRTFN